MRRTAILRQLLFGALGISGALLGRRIWRQRGKHLDRSPQVGTGQVCAAGKTGPDSCGLVTFCWYKDKARESDSGGMVTFCWYEDKQR